MLPGLMQWYSYDEVNQKVHIFGFPDDSSTSQVVFELQALVNNIVIKSSAIQGAEVLEREGDRESAQAMHKQATTTCERDLGANQPDADHVTMLDRGVTKRTHWQAALEIKDGELYGHELLALLAYHPKACEARCSHWSANGLRSSSL